MRLIVPAERRAKSDFFGGNRCEAIRLGEDQRLEREGILYKAEFGIGSGKTTERTVKISGHFLKGFAKRKSFA
jgi:hypothetical protein